ncbi:methylated-DNA--[protein]-cysteine S-methyltransferase, partial [uncultured Fenollaria sp.]|uniref:methylated-DNA--[protein]-cysteine S-methyltransferase n=1 Tax=uncultured Fenollaria sp. TaxID=1686315 RepID=UPI0025F5ECBB
MITNYFDKNKTYYVHHFDSPLGEMTAVAEDDALVYLRFGHQGIYGSKKEKNEIIDRTVKQLDEYFKGERKDFDIPIRVKAKEFQERALKEIRNLKYGETCTYGDIALKLGKKTYSRGVGA